MGVILRVLLEKYKQKIQQVTIYNRLEFKSISLTWQKNSSMIREVHCRCSSQSFAGLLMSATWRINSSAWLFSTWLENEKGNKMLRSRFWFDTFKWQNIDLWQPCLHVKEGVRSILTWTNSFHRLKDSRITPKIYKTTRWLTFQGLWEWLSWLWVVRNAMTCRSLIPYPRLRYVSHWKSHS